MKWGTKTKKRKSGLIEWVEAISIAMVIVVVFRFFCFDLFVVPTTSMEGSVLPGDFVLVNKWHYGSRIPITPLSLPFVHQYMPFSESSRCYSDVVQLPYLRLPGTKYIERNDLVVFNYPLDMGFPVDQKTFYIKRCVALPGDEFEIDAKEVYTNGDYLEAPSKAKFLYHVKTNGVELSLDSLKKLGITDARMMSNQGDWNMYMDGETAAILKQKPKIHHVIKLDGDKNELEDFIFPQSDNIKWNKDFFGPIVIPRAGDSILLNVDNLPLYAALIERYEENEIEVQDTLIYINGKEVDSYTFQQNYYFMMGDNRDNSDDSRYWGFVPEDHIVGHATHTMFSVDKSKSGIKERFRWERFFSSIE